MNREQRAALDRDLGGGPAIAVRLEEPLRAEAARRGLEVGGPLRVERYDNDGMGPTGELVIELQLPISSRD